MAARGWSREAFARYFARYMREHPKRESPACWVPVRQYLPAAAIRARVAGEDSR